MNFKKHLPILIFSLFYLTWFVCVVGFQTQHLIILLIFLLCFYASQKSKKVILGFSPFIIYALVYDSLRAFPSDMLFDVNIEDPYVLEKALFSISGLTPNEFFQKNPYEFLDVLGGIFYLSWVPGPVLFSIYLWVTNQKELFLKFSYCFLFLNLIGFVIYYLYPAAPPWYVELYGFEYLPDVPPSQGRLANFDEFFGIELFKGMYSKNANKFAAIPSLHSAYPVALLLYAGRRYKKLIFPCLILCFGIWFSAVYLNHHYLIDVILGVSVAFLSFILLELDFKNNGLIKKILKFHLKSIE